MNEEKMLLKKIRNFDFSKVVYLEWLNYPTIGDNSKIVVYYLDNDLLKVVETESFINDQLFYEALGIMQFGQKDLISVHKGIAYISTRHFYNYGFDKSCLILQLNKQYKLKCLDNNMADKIKNYLKQTKEYIANIKSIIKGKDFITIKEIQNEMQIEYVRIVKCVEILIGQNILKRSDEKIVVVKNDI